MRADSYYRINGSHRRAPGSLRLFSFIPTPTTPGKNARPPAQNNLRHFHHQCPAPLMARAVRYVPHGLSTPPPQRPFYAARHSNNHRLLISALRSPCKAIPATTPIPTRLDASMTRGSFRPARSTGWSARCTVTWNELLERKAGGIGGPRD